MNNGAILGLAQENIELIEKIIKTNSRFRGNDDLFEEIFSESVSRSRSLISSASSGGSIEIYISKIINLVVLDSLKRNNRFGKAKTTIAKVSSPVQHIAIKPIQAKTKEVVTPTAKYMLSEVEELVFDIDDPFVENEKELYSKDEVIELKDFVFNINQEFPEKKYYELFILRFIYKLDQQKIAAKVEETVEEVNSRIIDLVHMLDNFW